MINLVLPIGSKHGWGMCGRYLTRELARSAQVRLITNPWVNDLGPFEQRFLESRATVIPLDAHPMLRVNGPVLLGAQVDFSRIVAEVHGSSATAYTFFEVDSVLPAAMERARAFDSIAVGSTWCEKVLNAAGLTNTFVAVQGIDPLLFNAHDNHKEFFPDMFTVFSGGKLEYRKGQDLVIRAFKVLADRHKDVLLVNAWHNNWPELINSLAASSHIHFPNISGQYEVVIRHLLAVNGIDPARVMILGPTHNSLMPRIYKDTDVGLFPNRCEGGTNLVLMEYMACGKPAIASFNTGHMDVLDDAYAIPIRNMHPQQSVVTQQSTTFYEADVDETIEHLEWAYQNRDQLKKLGTAAGEQMKTFTWARTAETFQKHLKQ